MKNISMKNTSSGVAWFALGLIAVLGAGVWWFVSKLSEEALNFVLGLLDLLVGVLIGAVTLFFNMVAKIAAAIINSFIILDPFSQISIAPLLWEFFKNISYVVLVFLSLWAGFQFILNREDEARRLLIGILIIAFLINFTYVLAREFFLFFWHLTKSVLNLIGNVTDDEIKNENNSATSTITYTRSNFGEILLASLSFFLGENAKTIGDRIQQEMRSISGIDEESLIKRGVALSFGLFSLSMAFIGTALMFIFAGIAFGKFFIISFLVGVLPLACIAYLLPNQKKYFDQWWHLFLTWNINLLILIILIMIGIFLFASTNSESIFKIEAFLNPRENTILGNDMGKIIEISGQLISLSLRFIVISVYYVLVIILALNMGGRFAKAGYDFAKWIWTKTGGLIYDQAKGIAAGPLSRLGNKMTDLANKLAQYGGPAALLAKKIRSAGEALKKPAKERDKEIAEEAWEAAKNKSPEEIAKIANRLQGGELAEFANLINKYKSPDEIFRIFVNSERLQQDPRIRKILCGEKLNCALDTIMKGNPEDRAKAMQLLAQRLDFTKTNLSDFEKLLTSLGVNIQEKSGLLRTLTDYLTDRNARNFFAHPDNLIALKKAGLAGILQENQEIIKQTPTFRVFQDTINDALEILGITDENLRASIIQKYNEDYLRGEINSATIEGWQSKPDQLLDNLQGKVSDIKTKIDTEIGQINSVLSQVEESEKKLQDIVDDLNNSGRSPALFLEHLLDKNPDDLNRLGISITYDNNIDLTQLGLGIYRSGEEAFNAIQNKLNELRTQTTEMKSRKDELATSQGQLGQIPTAQQLGKDKAEELISLFRKILPIMREPSVARPRETLSPEMREAIEEAVRKAQPQQSQPQQ